MARYQSQSGVITWKATGGDKTLTLTNMANAAGRAGQSIDLATLRHPSGPFAGLKFPRRLVMRLKTKIQANPTVNLPVDLYWAGSPDGLTFPGRVTGADAAFTVVRAPQLLYVGSIPAVADTDLQDMAFAFSVNTRYGCPVVINNSGAALSNTAGDHLLELYELLDE